MIRALILLGFALYIAKLSSTGSLHYYVAPEMHLWLRISVIPLVLMSVATAWRTLLHKKTEADCGCAGHAKTRSQLKNTIIHAIFIFPLALGVLLPDEALGSMAASRKGMTLGSPLLSAEQLDDKFIAPDKYNMEFAELAKRLYVQETIEVDPEIYSETIGAVELFKEDFKGKRIKLSGFVYRDDSPGSASGKEIVLGRFLVQCCTADAHPFGVPVLFKEAAPLLAPDTWIEVEGTLGTEIRKEKEVIVIMADRVKEIPPPDTPYVYPNSNAVEQLIGQPTHFLPSP